LAPSRRGLEDGLVEERGRHARELTPGQLPARSAAASETATSCSPNGETAPRERPCVVLALAGRRTVGVARFV
ncbi:MAG: hypothetical protein M3O46_17255, partial [Myxococcota bacterium]|nr:hypothetical protein [Myxococcota bacterium]